MPSTVLAVTRRVSLLKSNIIVHRQVSDLEHATMEYAIHLYDKKIGYTQPTVVAAITEARQRYAL